LISEEFQRVFEQISPEAHSLACHLLGNPEDAEDAVQDAFMKAYESRGKFRGEASLATWITRILINGCMTRKHRPNRVREGEVPLETADAERDGVLDEEESLSAKIDSDDFRKKFDILPEREAMAMELRYYRDYSYREISREMNTPLGTVNSLLSRGHKRMKIRIKNERKRNAR
jgi:RNA polymerase sigma-70 factor (ECF subfamily)